MTALLDRLSAKLLRFLRVPSEPHPPEGSAGSLQVFRPGLNYFRLKRVLWGIRQFFVIVGIVWSVLFLQYVVPKVAQLGATSPNTPAEESATTVREVSSRSAKRRAERQKWGRLSRAVGKFVADKGWLIWTIKCTGILVALTQMLFTYLLLRLDYRQRWYLVTDRSLRIRHGIGKVHEMTLSFANIQQTTVRQGPLQRLLGLSDLVVTTAGGGASSHGEPGGNKQEAWHTGVLESIDNAAAVRDLIQSRLRQIKTSGLGDTDEPATGEVASDAGQALGTAGSDPRIAATDLLVAIRECRSVFKA